MRTARTVVAVTSLATALACSGKQPATQLSAEAARTEADDAYRYALCDAESADVTVSLRLQVDGVCDDGHDFHFKKLMFGESEDPTVAHTTGYSTHGDGAGGSHGTGIFFLGDSGPSLKFSVSVYWRGRDGDKGDVKSTLEVGKGRDAQTELAPRAKVLWKWSKRHNQRVQPGAAGRSEGRDEGEE